MQLHGTRKCTVKCISIRSLYSARTCFCGGGSNRLGKVCVVNWPFYPSNKKLGFLCNLYF